WFCNVLKSQGKFPEALAQMKQAQELDPLSPIINAALADTLSVSGKEDEAIELLKAQIALDRSFVPARNILGRVYIWKWKLPEAIAELEASERLDGGEANTLSDLGLAYARAGRRDDARKVLGRLQELQRQGFENRVRIALVQHALGDDQHALELLEKAVD